MKKPLDFVGVAAAKSGTSWLHACLSEHPQLFLPKKKELDYFSKEFSKGTKYLDENFSTAPLEKLWGEFSPSYGPSRESAERLFEHNPRIKLIWMLREPVDRAYSHYCMACRTQEKILNIEEILSENSEFISYGHYGEQLRNYLNLFPKEQHLILHFEDLNSPLGPQKVLSKTLKFLGVDSNFTPSLLDKRVNTRKSLGRFPRLYNLAKNSALQIAKKSSLAEKALNIFRQSPAMATIHKLNSSKDEFMPLDDKLRDKLVKYYQDDQKLLAELLK